MEKPLTTPPEPGYRFVLALYRDYSLELSRFVSTYEEGTHWTRAITHPDGRTRHTIFVLGETTRDALLKRGFENVSDPWFAAHPEAIWVEPPPPAPAPVEPPVDLAERIATRRQLDQTPNKPVNRAEARWIYGQELPVPAGTTRDGWCSWRSWVEVAQRAHIAPPAEPPAAPSADPASRPRRTAIRA